MIDGSNAPKGEYNLKLRSYQNSEKIIERLKEYCTYDVKLTGFLWSKLPPTRRIPQLRQGQTWYYVALNYRKRQYEVQRVFIAPRSWPEPELGERCYYATADKIYYEVYRNGLQLFKSRRKAQRAINLGHYSI